MQKKRTSPVFWLALIGLAAAAYVLTTPEDTAKKTTSNRTTTKKKAADSLFTDEDYNAKFQSLNTKPKNAFMPVVMRRDGTSTSNPTPNGLPTNLTGGEGGWIYTGTAEVNGKIQAVVENQGTGQGDFLSVGQSWKKARVVAVTDSSLVLEDETGQQVTIKMQEKLSTGSVVAGGFTPMNVQPPAGLRGPIGPLTVRPDGANTPPMQTEGDNNAN